MTSLGASRISNKILAVLAMFALLGAGLTFLASSSIRQLAANERRLIDVHAANLRLTELSQEHLTRLHQLAFEIVSADGPGRGHLQQRFGREASELQSYLANFRPLASPADEQLLKSGGQSAQDYLALWARTSASLAAGDQRGALKLLQTTGVEVFDRGDLAFDALVDRQTAELNQEAQIAQHAARRSLLVMTAAGLLGLLFIGAIARSIVLSQITAPLGSVTEALNRLARGELNADIPDLARRDEVGDLGRAFRAFRQAALDYRAAEEAAAEQRLHAEEERLRHEAAQAAAARQQAEAVHALADGLARLADGDLVFRIGAGFPESYAKLRDDFNAAMDQLQDAMGAIKSSILGIRASADEISQSAEDMSRRTEQQAASLEESAAALDQITGTVRRTAEGSAEASKVVLAATTDAERSSIVVRDAVSAMGEIEQSAQQIAEIIGVIDEIAFQTNLLALNAGVEAARAGDAGRGFAVVASEVRALAQRSAEAARAIKSLISTSGRQVASGVQLVGQTGQTLERILINIGEINSLVADFAASAAEQASSLHEVNSAIDQMDHGTQQNASMVEENTAASFALASEAQQLADLIGRFRIGAAAAPSPATRRPRSVPTASGPRPAPPLRRRVGQSWNERTPDTDDADGDWQEL